MKLDRETLLAVAMMAAGISAMACKKAATTKEDTAVTATVMVAAPAGSEASVNVAATAEMNTMLVEEPPAPPLPKQEKQTSAPGPAGDYWWVEGHWRWNAPQRRYVWIEGHWANRWAQRDPPLPRPEREGRMRPGYAWVRGHWKWGGRDWVWIEGHYDAVRPGHRNWVNGRWERRGARWHWVEGHWER